MLKNGKKFVSVIKAINILPGIWDPHAYREDNGYPQLSEFVVIERLSRARSTATRVPIEQIEYSSIPKGDYLTFHIDRQKVICDTQETIAGEQELLFGTMRAYLGNVLVTPEASWIGFKSPIVYPVKSEFVRIVPHDGCVYFWLLHLRSKSFLSNLPLGSGGTRPRLQPDALGSTPVRVPDDEYRASIHNSLKRHAAQEWSMMTRLRELVESSNLH